MRNCLERKARRSSFGRRIPRSVMPCTAGTTTVRDPIETPTTCRGIVYTPMRVPQSFKPRAKILTELFPHFLPNKKIPN